MKFKLLNATLVFMTMHIRDFRLHFLSEGHGTLVNRMEKASLTNLGAIMENLGSTFCTASGVKENSECSLIIFQIFSNVCTAIYFDSK